MGKNQPFHKIKIYLLVLTDITVLWKHFRMLPKATLAKVQLKF